ncbi:hypothetical protein H0H92_008302 [Tricholoma furcatifolium]|nr:hypothetical protein H0H92_008302 [Tricholoma furcatifolium]
MKRLRLNSHSMCEVLGSNFDSTQLQLPDGIIIRSASLEHLILAGYWIDWRLSPAFGRSLKTLGISSLPTQLQPSETLSVLGIDRDAASTSHGIKRVHMQYLRHLETFSKHLSSIISLLEHLTFSKENIVTVKISRPWRIEEFKPTPVQKMTHVVDDVTSGSVLELVLGAKILCWKARRKNRSASTVTESSSKQVVIVFDLGRLSQVAPVLRSLRLDRLVYLEVNYGYMDWSLPCLYLPCLEELKVLANELAVITALSHGLSVQWSDTGQTQPGPGLPFPALTHLTVDWDLDRILIIASQRKTIAERLLDCVKLRNAVNLPLKRLTILGRLTDSNLSKLKEVIEDVKTREEFGYESEETA